MSEQAAFWGEERLTERAIRSVADHADPAWVKAARWTIWTWPVGECFLAEDVVARLDQRNVRTPDRRAMGALIKECRALGWIAADGYGAAKSSHGAPKVRWRRLP